MVYFECNIELFLSNYVWQVHPSYSYVVSDKRPLINSLLWYLTNSAKSLSLGLWAYFSPIKGLWDSSFNVMSSIFGAQY